MRRGTPADIDAMLINRRGGGGKRVVAVLVVRRERKGLLPKHLPADCADTIDGHLFGLVVTRGDKNFVTPQHRRGMARCGQREFPIEVFVGPGRRDGLGRADPAAVGSPKPWPFLSGPREQRDRKSTRLNSSHR